MMTVDTSFAAGAGFFPGAIYATIHAPSGPTAQQVQAIVSMFQYMITLLPLVSLLALVSLVLLWTGFRKLSKTGASGFSLPSKFTLVSVVGAALATPGMIVFSSSMIPLIASLAQPGGTSPGGVLGPLLAGLALVVIGVILELIGVIGGQILGLWRVGERYGQTTLKVGAILTIVPLLSIAAPILVIVGISGAKQRALQPQPTGQ